MDESQKNIEDMLIEFKVKVNVTKNTVDEINKVLKEHRAHEEHEIFLNDLKSNLIDFMTESEQILESKPVAVDRTILSIPSELTALHEKYKETSQFLQSEEVSRLEKLCSYASCNYFLKCGFFVNRTKSLNTSNTRKAQVLFEEMFLKIVNFADNTWISDNKQALEELCFDYYFSELEQICIDSIENMLKAISIKKNKCVTILSRQLTQLEQLALKIFAKKFRDDLVSILDAYQNKKENKVSYDKNASEKQQAALSLTNALKNNKIYVIKEHKKTLLKRNFVSKKFFGEFNRFGKILTLVDWYQKKLFKYLGYMPTEEIRIQEEKSSRNTIKP